jgi:diguanylate cyclase (GGDEF)-like protein/PAS domain S-box-containing protein
MKRISLSEIMSPSVITVSPTTPVNEVLSIMENRHISCVVAVDENHIPLGIFTEQDAIRLMANHRVIAQLCMADVMSAPPMTAQGDVDFREGYHRISEKGYRHILVTDACGKLLGVASETDFMHHMGMEYLIELKTVASIMTREVKTLATTATLDDAAILMAKLKISCALITEDNKPIGIITERDIVSLVRTVEDPTQVQITEVMTSPVQTIQEDYPLQEAMKKMEHNKVRRLVVTKGNQIAGLVTRHDIVKAIQGRYIEFLHETLERQRLELEQSQTQILEVRQQLLAHSLMEQVQDSIIVSQAFSGRIVDINEQTCRDLGYSREALLQLKTFDIAPALFVEATWQADRDTFAREGKRIIETTHRRQDGSEFPVEISARWVARDNEHYIVAIAHDLTARKETEQKLLASEHTYRGLINSVDDVIYVHDEEGKILDVNVAAEAMYGYDHQEFIGKTAEFLAAPDKNDWDKVLESAQLAMSGVSQRIEFWGKRKNGEIFPKEVILSKGEYFGKPALIVVAREITERKKQDAEREQLLSLVSENEQRWKFALEGAGDGVWDWNPQSDEALFSKAWKAMLGYAENEFLNTGKHWIAQIHPEDKNHVLAAVQDYFAGKKPVYTVEFRMKCKDGSWKWILARGMLVSRDHLGNPLRMTGTHTDISKQKQSEQQLRIAATAFESQEGMAITDADGIILRVNSAFSSITGYSAENAVGQNPRFLKSGRHAADFYVAMWESIKHTGSWEGEIWNRRKNGAIYPEHLTITAVKNNDGNVTNYVATLTDITQSKAAEDEIKHLASYDSLTGLPNRRLLLDRLRQALATRKRSGHAGALLFIDLDNFKSLNDTLGHDIGDLLLQQVAIRLASCVREDDTVARLGGDEFVLMLEDLSEDLSEAAAQTEAIGNKILALLNQPYQLAEHEYLNTPSIGASLFTDDTQTPDELMKQADIAMYQSKKAGRNALRFFDPQMQASIYARATLESELRKAIDLKQFQLYFQIQVEGSAINGSHRVLGAEVLIRWIHPERGVISPIEFIPLAEETGLIIPIGQWVLETACAQLKVWQKNPLTERFYLAINVSAKQFRQATFVAEVQTAIHTHQINPKLLKLELTESLLLEDVEEMISTMNALNEIGVEFSLDDFGTGYSSLQYLKRLPLDQLKIDQSFVREIASNHSDKAIVRTIIAMAHSLNLNVIAEGVETESQRALLMEKGCQSFQGYLFGRPMSIENFEALLNNN